MAQKLTKYWLLTSEFPPFFGGGISTYCVHMSRMLQQQGHDVSVFVYDNAVRDLQIQTESGIRVIRFSPNRSGTRAFLGYSTQLSYEYAAVVRLFVEREGEPDVVESQEYLGIAYYLLQFRWLGYDWCRNLKVVITTHSPAFLYLPQNHISTHKYPLFWLGEMERFCLKAADLLISPTQFLLDAIQTDTDISRVPKIVIPNPYSSAGKTVEVTETAQRRELVLVAKLSAQKGSFRVLKYMEDVWKENPNIRLTMLGDDSIVYHPEKRSMGDILRQRYATDIREGRLRLLPKVPSSEYKSLLQEATIALVPSTFDNLPYVVLEMMALGKCVLASRQGGQAEIIQHGENGFLFDHDVPDGFKTQLLALLQLSTAENLKLARAAQRTVSGKYNYERIYELKQRALQSLTNRTDQTVEFPFIRTNTNDQINQIESGNSLLSIVVTYYNSSRFLAQILQNLQETSYVNKEIIIINDGSTGTVDREALDRVQGQQNIRVIHQSNQGLGASRNRGALEAKGQFLTFIDADDLVMPDYYEKAISVLSRFQNVHYVGAWTRYFEGSEKVWPTFQPEPPILLYHNTINSAALVFKRESFLTAGGNDTAMVFPGLEDYELLVSMAARNMAGVVLPEVKFQYRVRQDSMVRGINPYKRQLIGEYIRAKNAELYAKHSTDLLALQEMNGPAHLIDNPSLDYDFADKLPVAGKMAIKLATFVKRNKFLRPVAYRLYRMIN